MFDKCSLCKIGYIVSSILINQWNLNSWAESFLQIGQIQFVKKLIILSSKYVHITNMERTDINVIPQNF